MTMQMLSYFQPMYKMLQRKCVPHTQGSEYNNQCRIYMKIVVIKPDEKWILDRECQYNSIYS